MSARCIALLCLLTPSVSLLYCQARPTASRVGDLQIGAGVSIAQPDYLDLTLANPTASHVYFKGPVIYADFDFSNHFGVEAEFHEVVTPEANKLYEKTYELGGRYFRTYGLIKPYGKIMIGRGVFNYDNGNANLAYNMAAFGGGADFKLTSYLNVRADYEYQHWSGFPFSHLNPQLVTIGLAYHFRSERRPYPRTR